MEKIILGFVGDIAAGKGTVCAFLHEKTGAPSYRFSTMLRDILDRMYIEKTRHNLQKISTLVRQEFGQDVMSKVIAEDVKQDPNPVVAVEGIRRPSDITYLRELPNFHLIYITADPKIRWQRVITRNENPGDAQKTFEAFLSDEESESDRLVKELGKTAQFTIHNDGSFLDLHKQIQEIINKIKP